MSSIKKQRKIIGENIRHYRKARNISIEELAEMIKLSDAFIGAIERGQRGAKLTNLLKIADIFGITLNDLVYCNSESTRNNEDSISQQKKDSIMSLIYDFKPKELDYIISSIKNLKTLKRSESKVEKTDED